MDQVLTNLVSNGIRYNREGGRLSVRLVDTGKHVAEANEANNIRTETWTWSWKEQRSH